MAGDLPRAQELLQAAVDSCPAGRTRARALAELAAVMTTVEGFPVAADLLRAALAEPELESQERVTALCDLAWAVGGGRARREGQRYAEEALEAAERDHHALGTATSLITVAEMHFWRSGQLQRPLLDRAVSIELETGHDLGARDTLARLLSRADLHDEARDLFDTLIDEGNRRDDPCVLGSHFFAARNEIAAGNWDDAVRRSEDGIELALQTGEQAVEALCRTVQAEVVAYRDEPGAALLVDELLAVAEQAGFQGARHRLTRAMACVELAHHRPERAWARVAPLLADRTELDEIGAQLAASVGVESALGVGDVDEAQRLLDLAREIAADADSALAPLVARCQGQVLVARGETAAALDVLAAAARITAPYGVNPLEAARTLLALGTAQRLAHRKRAARESLEAAATAFETLGAAAFATRARSELRRIGGRTSSADSLSETEQLIVDRVVKGLRNREIAAELSISPHTVAWNLSKIYRKLAVSSRTELASQVHAPEGKPTPSDG